ncbi:DUF983 domain-containing protein [Primorskyibacter aestuariivivens]|uniref:DUF983 domain-containing protein n=1 Tax=Primorskyibacter aestuariivivens TaxID=1888912 RepID=UPI0023012896|nr:DUF983 domain-containing protein [Primorskyibacter aestuariivivens]MDA7427971.1 DUF983 domain-containing protein [Primorskyibacter aestuariivivens]
MNTQPPDELRRVKSTIVGPIADAADAPDGFADRSEDDARETWPTVWKGWRRKCPNCGSGPLLSGYLKVRDTCPVCREELHHHRADDGPAYLTILIVGHIMAPLLHVVFVNWRPEPLVLFTIFAVGTIALSLYLLPRLKGAIVGFQWARRMYGFGRKK